MRLGIERAQSPRRRTMKTTVALAIAYTVVLVVIGGVSLAASVPPNIVWGRAQLPGLRANLNKIVGQDFAFFTRSPETDEIDAYRLTPEGTIGDSLLVTPQAEPGNLYGVSRTQRAQGPELAILLREVPASGWIDCATRDRGSCIDELRGRRKARLHNDSPLPTLCGDVVLSIESTTKWAYRHLADTRYSIERIAAADIDCAGQG